MTPTKIITCLLCPSAAQAGSCFCLACDNGNVGGASSEPLRPRCRACGMAEAMHGRTVCESCAR